MGRGEIDELQKGRKKLTWAIDIKYFYCDGFMGICICLTY